MVVLARTAAVFARPVIQVLIVKLLLSRILVQMLLAKMEALATMVHVPVHLDMKELIVRLW